MSKDPEKVRAILEQHYPEFVYSYMDNSFYWKSMDEKQPGDIIEHEGKRYVVKYSWAWWQPFDVQVYMAELEPEDE